MLHRYFAIAACLLAEPVWSRSRFRGYNDPMTVELKNKTICQVAPEIPFLSQHGDDEVVFDIFFSDPPKCKGTVVEIGGMTGKLFSNSWFFEYALNWRTLLVEASPANFAKMVKNRPGATNVYGAVCSGPSIKFRTGKGQAVGGIADEMSQKHIDRWTDDKAEILEVPCVLLSDVLKNNGIGHVDIFFLDVEGGEAIVLDTFDWTVTIDVIIVELDGGNKQKDESVRTTLRSHGYITPLSWNDECRRKRGKVCYSNELFVLETFWNDRKRLASST